jgi:hypothetical protein
MLSETKWGRKKLIRTLIHTFLHFLVPGLAARFAFRENRWKKWFIMMATMLVDLDHLLASPIFDSNRCGIGFHPLHSYPAIFAYLLMTAVPKLRIIGIGLLIHMGLDFTDCIWMQWD